MTIKGLGKSIGNYVSYEKGFRVDKNVCKQEVLTQAGAIHIDLKQGQF